MFPQPVRKLGVTTTATQADLAEKLMETVSDGYLGGECRRIFSGHVTDSSSLECLIAVGELIPVSIRPFGR